MDQVAGEHRLVAALAGADREMVGRVARGRGQADMVVERVVAGDELGPVGLDDRQHAVGDLVERRLLMDLAPVGVFLFREQVARLREGRDPAAVLQPRVPPDMVAVQMRAHHEVDVLDPEPGRLERLHPVGVVLLVPGRPQREVLVVADAGIDQDVVVRRLDDIGLEAQHDIAGRRCHSRRARARRGSPRAFPSTGSAGIRASA